MSIVRLITSTGQFHEAMMKVNNRDDERVGFDNERRRTNSAPSDGLTHRFDPLWFAGADRDV